MHQGFRSRVLSVLASVAAAAGVLATDRAEAQYSTDSLSPWMFWSTATDDVQVKIAKAPEGGQYVSYFSGPGYDVMLMRLDKTGAWAWPAPVVVEDRTLSSTVDYGMASDALGNAYVAFDGSNAGVSAIKVQSVGPTGAVRWTKTVTQSSTAYLANAHVCVASDGAVWVCHVQDKSTAVQRFDAATGTQTFASPILITEGTFNQLGADIQPSTAGGVIVSCVRYTTFSGAKTLRAHKFNVDGTRPWAAVGVFVFSTGSLQFGNFPTFLPDGSGGAYFCWYTTGPLQCWLQRVSDAGTVMYGVNGIAVTSTSTNERVSPSMTVGPDGRVYVFWSEHVPNSSIYGTFGQCFLKGVRQWGDLGAAIEPLSTIYSRTWATAGVAGNTVLCFYNDATSGTQDNNRCAALSPAGGVLWKKDIATSAGSKYRFVTNSAPDNGCVIAWQGGVTIGASDLFAARIDAKGTMGPPPAGITGDLNGDGAVNSVDIAILLSQWGGSGSADLSGNGIVASEDIAILLSNWT